MQVRYFKDSSLAYASRQRHLDISRFIPFAGEENKSVRLGDGANTSIKTSVENICDYVMIDYTRWFVTDYVYLNGKQVQLNLQRDVVGEFGLGQSYGKIERGYTDGILKYRKELSLNEVLKKRVPLKSSKMTYGNLRVDNHDNEMWGVLYFTKDSTKDKISITIPEFAPAYETGIPPQINVDYSNGAVSQNISFEGDLFVKTTKGNKAVRFRYEGNYTSETQYSSNITSKLSYVTEDNAAFVAVSTYDGIHGDVDSYTSYVLRRIKEYLDQNLDTNGYTRPSAVGIIGLEKSPQNVDGYVYKDGSEFYQYKANYYRKEDTGNYDFDEFVSGFNTYFNSQDAYWSFTGNRLGYWYPRSLIYVPAVKYSRSVLPHSVTGTIDVSMTQQLVDEPYCILIFPLYTTNLTIGGKTYSISRDNAFRVFNTVIENLTGVNPFIVDAQIYPYCPNIDKVQTSLVDDKTKEEYPFFSVLSTSFETDVSVQPMPYMDVKKEYITRNYSIVSPDQSNKFTFSFYDYVNQFVPSVADNRYNSVVMNIKIKTALKPFSIISSAVITRANSLKGINYESNLEGSQSASGGFECSLSSDAFETYKRQNSNYQQLFDIDRNELRKSQEVERVNEATQFAMNMITGTAFGAVAGASLADVGIWNSFGAKAVGAGIGAGVSAATIGTAGGIQMATNEKLRAYEREIQQQRFDLTIGTIKNLPNSVNRISSFNEIIMKDFYYVLETYECTDEELGIVDDFINNYGYGIGVYDFLSTYQEDGWFLKASVLKSNLPINLHQIFKNDIEGGVYIDE